MIRETPKLKSHATLRVTGEEQGLEEETVKKNVIVNAKGSGRKKDNKKARGCANAKGRMYRWEPTRKLMISQPRSRGPLSSYLLVGRERTLGTRLMISNRNTSILHQCSSLNDKIQKKKSCK